MELRIVLELKALPFQDKIRNYPLPTTGLTAHVLLGMDRTDDDEDEDEDGADDDDDDNHDNDKEDDDDDDDTAKIRYPIRDLTTTASNKA